VDVALDAGDVVLGVRKLVPLANEVEAADGPFDTAQAR